VFLDELLNANSAILNSLLVALNERMFRRGKETRPLRALMFVGASNHLPEDDALNALFDRFLLRVHCDNVPDERLGEVLVAGWKLVQLATARSGLHFDDLQIVHAELPECSCRKSASLLRTWCGIFATPASRSATVVRSSCSG